MARASTKKKWIFRFFGGVVLDCENKPLKSESKGPKREARKKKAEKRAKKKGEENSTA